MWYVTRYLINSALIDFAWYKKHTSATDSRIFMISLSVTSCVNQLGNYYALTAIKTVSSKSNDENLSEILRNFLNYSKIVDQRNCGSITIVIEK